MRVTFRQGIARYQTDLNGSPTFLQRSGAFIDLVVSPDPTVLLFAHRDGTYLVEEFQNVHNAWGPFSGSTTQYLYWDVNLLDAQLTRGFTSHPVLYTSAAPTSPLVDQHWFDTIENVFRVWSGAKWVEKIRLFACTYSSSAIIIPEPRGSQAGLIGDFKAGNIVLGTQNKPLRQSNGCFLTSADALNIVNRGTTTIKMEGEVISGMASESIPAFSAVQVRLGGRLELARSSDHNTRVSGIVVEDVNEGEVQNVISYGIIRNQAWGWPDNKISRPIFCDGTGQITTVAPTIGVVQQLGLVWDADAVLIDMKQPIVLDSSDPIITPPPPPPSGAPIANFSASVLSGPVPLSVSFMNLSTGSPDLIEWDFNNDGFIDTTTVNPTYVFSTPGNHTVRMRASNAFGNSEKIISNLISVLGTVGGPSQTNLGISIVGPVQATGGQAFNIDVVSTNDGLLTATNVQRTIKLSTSDHSLPIVMVSPPGSAVTQQGFTIVIVLPPISAMVSGASQTVTFALMVSPTATSLAIEASISSLEPDIEDRDNKVNLSIGVRP